MQRAVTERRAAPAIKAAQVRLGLLLALSFCLPANPAVAAPQAVQTVDQLLSLRTKQLARRVPEAQEQLVKARKKVEGLKQADPQLAGLIEDYLTDTIMSSGSLSEDRLREKVEFLSDLSGPTQTLSQAEKTELASHYERVCASLDDQIFIKQLDEVLARHDKLIQHIRYQLWDRGKVDSELAAIEEAILKAPPLPYGRLELLRSLSGRKMAQASTGCYVGARGQPYLLSASRPATVGLEETQATALALEEIWPAYSVAAAGQYADFDKAAVSYGPFSPPLTLVLKTRLIEGRIPFVTLKLDGQEGLDQSGCVQDILDGKLDDYLTRNFKLLASLNAPVAVGLFESFDHAAESAFGPDGRTPYYLLVDQKLAKLPAAKQKEEAARRASKGAYLKSAPDLNKYYGDASLPDGPERVRDAWKRIRDIATKCGATSLSFYACAAAGHGDRKLLSSGCAAQDWNQLSYYWPGDAVIDWLAVEPARYQIGKKTPAGDFAAEFFAQAKASPWRSTAIALLGLEPEGKDALAEDRWLSACFQEFLPGHPSVKACVLGYPGNLLMWSPESAAAFRRGIASNSYYKQKLKLLPAKP